MGTIRRVSVASAMVVLALGLAACSSTPSATKHKPSSEKPISGGVVKWAEAPSAVPNFIFPYLPPAYFSATNGALIDTMWRPLYWPGSNTNVTIEPTLSMATLPVWSDGGKVATIHMTGYKWSNGEPVDAQDVVFWMNLMKLEYTSLGSWFPGSIPSGISSITTPNANTVVFTLSRPVNETWFAYNDLAQITPLPMAWDVTARGQKQGAQACGTSSYRSVAVKMVNGAPAPANAIANNCVAVFDFLEQQSGYDPLNPKKANNSYATYATNPLWQVVDGPFHLVAFNSTGYVALKPNPKYSGPIKAKIAEFEELPFTSDTAEYNALVGGKLTMGYIPSQDLPTNGVAKSATVAGPNAPRLAGNYNLTPWVLFGFNYFPMNMNSVGDGGEAGKIFQQLYFRQAVQYMMDQPLFLKKLWKGYGVPTYGPVPLLPKNPYVTKIESSNPYAYNPTKAKALLSANGWKVVPNGTDTCVNATKCGVPTGTALNFSMIYATGVTAFNEQIAAFTEALKSIGINITATGETFDTVLGTAFPPCSGSSCKWEWADWGGGWVYYPDFEPTGEEIFLPSASSNAGSFNDATMNQLISATDYSNTTLSNYENYAAKILPVVYQPNEDYSLTESSNRLSGVAQFQNAFGLYNPEYLYFTG
jgi:peptide/nickel transport system substrate-binding protein